MDEATNLAGIPADARAGAEAGARAGAEAGARAGAEAGALHGVRPANETPGAGTSGGMPVPPSAMSA
ncbi:hypothetical protein ABT369_16375 [Dactylosporangium sp. NPDC000244]|uniref:hypothetical protein n=1 Tax=Dactylosporangium sp. NPDC000244 TaxID=3154365 RepID=UPI00333295F4